MAPRMSSGPDWPIPRLTLDGVSLPLDHLLAGARAHDIDLSRLSLHDLLQQVSRALARAAPLAEKADWVVMTAWLLDLRARLLLPGDPPHRRAAAADARAVRANQALADWLDRRPQLGRDVFARGRPEALGHATAATWAVDVVGFLWASLALFADATAAVGTAAASPPPVLHSVIAARARIRERLGAAPAGQCFEQLLPAAVAVPAASGAQARLDLRHVSRWTSTFAACLELAKAGEVVLTQAGHCWPIHVVAALAPAVGGGTKLGGSAPGPHSPDV